MASINFTGMAFVQCESSSKDGVKIAENDQAKTVDGDKMKTGYGSSCTDHKAHQVFPHLHEHLCAQACIGKVEMLRTENDNLLL